MGKIKWQDIQGWFDESDAELYTHIFGQLPPESIIVEIGVWRGRSTAHLLNLIDERGDSIRLHCVDSFTGDELAGFRNTKAEFERNVETLRGLLTLHVVPSTSAAKYIRNTDFVFIDAAHDYNSVRSDIDAWLPTVKPGGWIAGHDIGMSDVRRAVEETFGQTYKVMGNSWYVQK